MANYTVNSWTTGDTITKTKMDRLEAGAAAALPSADAPELIRDTIGTALVAGTNMTVTVNDAGDTITLDAAAGSSVVTANTQTGTTYTLVLGDAGKVVEMNNASANVLTVPPNSSVAFPTGTVLEVAQYGAGQTTVAAGGGVTIRTPSTLILRTQYSTVALRKRGTDEWVLSGDVQ